MPTTTSTAAAFKKHPLYHDFIQVKSKLHQHGFICWIAGGAVRDILLGLTVADFDLVTDATTEQLIALFPEAIMVGVQFGVIKLHLPTGSTFDLATFRRESDYYDGRRPSKVDFATAAEDAKRRDFTINALFWNDDEAVVVDFEHGVDDIEQKKIRCVGVPAIRFQEDHLRILRLLRFSVQLQFKVEEETKQAAIAKVKSLEKISGERIWSEIVKMSAFIQWFEFFVEDLNKLIFKTLFSIEIENSIPINKQAQLNRADQSLAQPAIKLLYFLILFAKSETVLLKLLKNRLHLSRLEIDIFTSIQFVLNHPVETTINEWVYEIEKKPILSEILQFFYDIGIKSDYLQIQLKYKNRPEKLIDGHDLKNLVSPVDMARALRKIRLLQFEQPYLNKFEILALLKSV